MELNRLDPPRFSAGNPYASQGDRRSTIRVLLVDDHTILRQSYYMKVVGEAGNGMEVIEAV